MIVFVPQTLATFGVLRWNILLWVWEAQCDSAASDSKTSLLKILHFIWSTFQIHSLAGSGAEAVSSQSWMVVILLARPSMRLRDWIYCMLKVALWKTRQRKSREWGNKICADRSVFLCCQIHMLCNATCWVEENRGEGCIEGGGGKECERLVREEIYAVSHEKGNSNGQLGLQSKDKQSLKSCFTW